MIEDVLYSLLQASSRFEELVQDSFGASIVNSVFRPMISEISEMAEVATESEIEIAEIREIVEEARLKTGDS